MLVVGSVCLSAGGRKGRPDTTVLGVGCLTGDNLIDWKVDLTVELSRLANEECLRT